ETMKTILLHPSYFPSIETMAHIVQADRVIWETEDNFQKQTYRNRAYIAHSNGKLLLNVPVKHIHGVRQKSRDVLTDENVNWQKQHFKSIRIAYRTSPFFEYYEDDFEELFAHPAERLMEHNLRIYDFLQEILGFQKETSVTDKFEHEPEGVLDLRYLVNAKKDFGFVPEPYTQVLEEAHGFLPNLSVLDLIFNEGPQALTYLKNQKL